MYLLWIGGSDMTERLTQLFYNLVLVSAIHQREGAIGIHMSPALWTFLPLPTPSYLLGCHTTHSHYLSHLLYSHTTSLHWLCFAYFTYGNVYISELLSQFVPPSPSPTVSTSLFSMTTSPLLPCKEVYQYHLSRFHLYALIWYLFFSFWLTSLCIIGYPPH